MSTTATKKAPRPMPMQLATASWVAPLCVFAINHFIGQSAVKGEPSAALVMSLFAIVLYLFGLGCGVSALFYIRRFGKKGILVPAIIGIILNGVILAFFASLFITALMK